MAEFAGHDGNGGASQGGELENAGAGTDKIEGAESEQERTRRTCLRWRVSWTPRLRSFSLPKKLINIDMGSLQPIAGFSDDLSVLQSDWLQRSHDHVNKSSLDYGHPGSDSRSCGGPGEVLYRVRWKGYDSEGDTWEPEAHLDDCKEVLLEFRRKQAEIKQKAAKKEALPKLSDLFDAESDSDSQQGNTDESIQKKKKKSKDEEDKKLQEDLKKKSKSGKSKEKSRTEAEPSENQLVDSKPKKRLSESSEDLSSKKPKKEEKKSKKEDHKDGKVKAVDELKEKKVKKVSELEKTEKVGSPEPEVNAKSVSSEVLVDDGDRPDQDEAVKSQVMVAEAPEEPATVLTMDMDVDDIKLKKKKKKHKRKAEKDNGKKAMFDETHVEKKSLKKQKSVDKVKEPAPIPKSARPSSEEKTPEIG
ncbi:unnamed protein product [Ranitomeya imitator]|uniref:Chromo domain-containing protein n=1 Tax=Ranitomeya imitator TaxID=111125 RepID=A0ABN9L6K0_9NEOB|nr:unnamed protein product [Ranitomeya imitator]